MLALRSLLVFLLAAFYSATAFSSIRDASPIATRRAELQTGLSAKKKINNTGNNCTPKNQRRQQQVTSLFQSSQENTEPAVVESDASSEDGGDANQSNNKSSVVGITFLSGLVAVVAAAKTGTLGVYTDAMILRDAGFTFLFAILGYVLVKLITLGYEKDIYDAKVARKLNHTLAAPLYILFWPFFSAADGARYFAVLVTLTNVVRLYIAGTGGDSSLANAVSRSGDKSEALGGPFIYVCLFTVFLLLFWRTSMVGIIAMSTMAAGDGMADLVGRRWGRNNKWWFSDDKSVTGTTAFAVASSLTSIGLVQWLIANGCLQTSLEPMELAVKIIGISVTCALVELLPVGDDNYTVPLTAAALAALLLR